MAFPSICMALWMLLASMVMASIEAGPQDPTIHMWRDEGSVRREFGASKGYHDVLTLCLWFWF